MANCKMKNQDLHSVHFIEILSSINLIQPFIADYRVQNAKGKM